MTKQEKINLISTIILIGFCCAAYLHFVVSGSYLGDNYPFGTFLCCPSINFSDLHDIAYNNKDLHPYILEPSERRTVSNYFPFTFILIYPLSFLSDRAQLVFFLVTLIAVMLATNYYFLREKNYNKTNLLRNIFAFSFLTYPFLFLVDRGNIEFLLFFCEIIFLIFYLKNRLYTAVIFLSFATAMKLYPGVLFFLFLKDKKYKEFIFGAVFTVVISFLSLAVMRGGFDQNLQGLLNELHTSQHNIGAVNYAAGIFKSSTLFGLIKLIIMLFNLESVIELETLFTCFMILTILVGVMLYNFFIRFEQEKWKIVTILIFCSILFNYTSYGYKLISLFIPLWLFINHQLYLV